MHPIQRMILTGARSADPGRCDQPILGAAAVARRRAFMPACAAVLALSFLGPIHRAWPASLVDDTVTTPSIPARTWAVDCANNQVLVLQHSDPYLRYHMHVIDEKGDQVRDTIETPEGSVARLILRDGKPLTRCRGLG